MINWLMDQQVVLSISLLVLILLEAKAIRHLGANLVYALWLLIPLMLLANNLPQNSIALDNTSLYRYVVELGAQPSDLGLSLSWTIIWALGCTSILLLCALSQFKIQQISATSLLTTVHQSRLPKNLQVRSSKQLAGPILTGVLSPKILVPDNFHTDFSRKQQQQMLTHELVHYQRKDNFYNVLALVFIATFWFNPLAWFAYKAFRRNQELACDATVLKHANHQEKLSYSQALVQCAERSLHNFCIYSPYGEKHSMLKRLALIQTKQTIKPAFIGLSIAIGSMWVTGVAIANLADTSTQAVKVNDAAPVMRIEPKYPIQAAQDKQEGSVILEFDITEDGSTDNIKILESFPGQVFDKSAVIALKEWKYKPKIQGGQAQRQTGLKVQLDFRMDTLNPEQPAIASRMEKIKISH